MKPKRIALQLAAAGAAVIGLLAGMTQPAMAGTGATTTAKITPLAAASGCPTFFGEMGAGTKSSMLCGTGEVVWGWPTYLEDIVIGTDFRIWHATASRGFSIINNWSVLQNGAVLPDASKVAVLGIAFRVPNNNRKVVQIQVLGTNGHEYCNTKTDGGSWGGWTANSTICSQQPF